MLFRHELAPFLPMSEDRIFVVAGQNSNGKAEMLLSNGTWERKADCPGGGLAQSTLVEAQDHVYSLGGVWQTIKKSVKLVHRYNTENDTWTAMDPLPVAAHQLTCVNLDYRNRPSLFCARGTNQKNANVQNKVLLYDVANDTWSLLPDKTNTATERSVARVVGNMIYFVSALGPSTFFEHYDLDSESWGGDQNVTNSNGAVRRTKLVALSYDFLVIGK